MKTATIERYHIYGTMNHGLCVTYRGRVLHWTENGGYSVYADAPDWGQESIDAMRKHALNHGFTHCRFVGDWSKARKPVGGKLIKPY